METLFTKEMLKRITKTITEDGTEEYTVDLHELSKLSAMVFLRNIIALHRTPFTIRAIHGYVHGMVLKNSIQDEWISDRVTAVTSCPGNYGVTYLTVS